MSACSSSLSVHAKVEIKNPSKDFYVIKGTPADCVHIVSKGVLKKLPDIVFSGINFGSNLGDDVIYSGTVAGAIEGRNLKYSPVSISITSREPKYLLDIGEKLEFVLSHIFNKKYRSKNIFNINIPDIPLNKIKGIKYTCLGSRKTSHKPNITTSNQKILASIGPVGTAAKSTKSNDFNAIKSKYISITPLTIDMCDHKKIINRIYKPK
jgi:5'-nucleotidase